MAILVTGGAGYIGSVVVRMLCERELDVVALDNLSHGRKELVDKRAGFVEADIRDASALADALKDIQLVMHFAALKSVGESLLKPEEYVDVNASGTHSLLMAMRQTGVKSLIYSSTAAVYGEPEYIPVDEMHPKKPINPYGYSKSCAEDFIGGAARTYGLNYLIFRYFNVVGDGGLGYLDPQPENVLPKILETAIGKREIFQVFGNNYDTPDGTAIRDYVDISDLAEAHLRGMDLLLDNPIKAAINLGTHSGTSVRQLFNICQEITGINIPYEDTRRRAGDPASVVASNDEALRILGWEPRTPLEQSVRSQWKVYTKRNFKY